MGEKIVTKTSNTRYWSSGNFLLCRSKSQGIPPRHLPLSDDWLLLGGPETPNNMAGRPAARPGIRGAALLQVLLLLARPGHGQGGGQQLPTNPRNGIISRHHDGDIFTMAGKKSHSKAERRTFLSSSLHFWTFRHIPMLLGQKWSWLVCYGINDQNRRILLYVWCVKKHNRSKPSCSNQAPRHQEPISL